MPRLARSYRDDLLHAFPDLFGHPRADSRRRVAPGQFIAGDLDRSLLIGSGHVREGAALYVKIDDAFWTERGESVGTMEPRCSI